MTTSEIITTIFGGFMFPFLIVLVWGRLVDRLGPMGGWMAAGFIVGSIWMINHALPGIGFADAQLTKSSLIVQSGDAWIDMAWAAGVGLFVGSAVAGGGSVKKALPTVITVILGGAFGGWILGLIG